MKECIAILDRDAHGVSLIVLFFQMLVISAAGLLNAAILSMSHEHQGYFGCQLTYCVLGFAIASPLTAYLFEYLKEIEVPWYVYLL